jgi:predicted MFS family arabinose efflux permease
VRVVTLSAPRADIDPKIISLRPPARPKIGPGPLPRLLLATGAAIAAIGTAAAATAHSLALALLGIAIAGLGTSVCAPTVLSLAGRLAAPGMRASAISIVTTLGYSGFLLGPAVVGLAAQALTLCLALVGVALVAVAVAVLARVAPGR